MRLNKRELAIALAGIRLLQETWNNCKDVPNEILEILDEGNARHVTNSRIDFLCNKLQRP